MLSQHSDMIGVTQLRNKRNITNRSNTSISSPILDLYLMQRLFNPVFLCGFRSFHGTVLILAATWHREVFFLNTTTKKINLMFFCMEKSMVLPYPNFEKHPFQELTLKPTSHFDNTLELDLSFDFSEAEPSWASWKVGRAATPRDGRTRGVHQQTESSPVQQMQFSRLLRSMQMQ